ncbi:MAG: type IV toxin-antitoxin system AbiEi family antitoxin domain-containing protein [Ilumatobacter sp.]|uniref:type IV toxin-antitoxin system AbiEi family antitoxin domain-containing protein n=1 Tax=Ilumatobacter sp. TaxID=1967498 RepID=UPI0032987950
MTYLPAEAHARFAAQHGVASIEQLIDTGLTRRQIEYLVDRNCLVSVVRGAYSSPSVALGDNGRLAAICLARPAVVIAGPTA